MPIQGTAADILKRAMIDVDQRAAPPKRRATRMILTVHDELLFEAPRDDADARRRLVRETMASAVTLGVPLDVDVGIGENWKEAKPYGYRALGLGTRGSGSGAAMLRRKALVSFEPAAS